MTFSITYPQFRKYPNDKAYFKIISGTEWEEIRIVGKRKTLHHFDVKILPDRNYIEDMTFNYEGTWEKIDREEYEAIKNNMD